MAISQASRTSSNTWGCTASSSGNYIFNTGGKYVDTNIVINIPNAIATAQGGNIINGRTDISQIDNGIYFTKEAASFSVTSEGWVSSASGSSSASTHYVHGVTIPNNSDYTGESSFTITDSGNSITWTFTKSSGSNVMTIT